MGPKLCRTGSRFGVGMMARGVGSQGPVMQGRPGGVGEVATSRKGWGPSCLHSAQPHLPGKDEAWSDGEMGVSVRAPLLPLPHVIQVKPPGRRWSPRMAGGSEPQPLWPGEQVGSRCWSWTAPRPAAGGGGRWPSRLWPTVAHVNLTPALGVTELHGGGWCLQPPLRTQEVPSSKTAWCPPYLCRKCWSVPCPPRAPRQAWQEAAPSPLPEPCVPRAENASPYSLAVVIASSGPAGGRAGDTAQGKPQRGSGGLSRNAVCAEQERTGFRSQLCHVVPITESLFAHL